MIAQTFAQARSLIARWYSIPLLLLVWQVAVGSGLVESRLLPSPGRVWTALVTEIGNGALVSHGSVTISLAAMRPGPAIARAGSVLVGVSAHEVAATKLAATARAKTMLREDCRAAGRRGIRCGSTA